MHALAANTGGFLVENSNNLRAGLRKILDDTETYYVLAYEPTNTRRDGGFRRIEVRLPASVASRCGRGPGTSPPTTGPGEAPGPPRRRLAAPSSDGRRCTPPSLARPAAASRCACLPTS
jgi:hypothetical protein